LLESDDARSLEGYSAVIKSAFEPTCFQASKLYGLAFCSTQSTF
jgi:hypothetical protein